MKDIPRPGIDADRAVIDDIARRALSTVAPDELMLFDLTAADYYADPEAALSPKRRDEAVGFGLELAMLTPAVIAVVTSVVHLVGGMVSDAVKEQGSPAIQRLVRHVFRLPDPASSAPGTSADERAGAGLSVDQARRVHEVAYTRGQALGLDQTQAGLLADAITGGLVVAA